MEPVGAIWLQRRVVHTEPRPRHRYSAADELDRIELHDRAAAYLRGDGAAGLLRYVIPGMRDAPLLSDYQRFRRELSERTYYARRIARMTGQDARAANRRALERVCAKYRVDPDTDPLSEDRFNARRRRAESLEA
jgi:hypothetical protein